ncbi:MAG: hydantoinase/oxoprolinase family protein, partial [Geminicoccaceae bacterium]
VNINCSIIGTADPVNLSGLIDAGGRQADAEPATTRLVMFEGATHETPIYWRDHLPEDVSLDGPAIIEQLDTTIVIPPGDRVQGETDGNLIVHIGAGA